MPSPSAFAAQAPCRRSGKVGRYPTLQQASLGAPSGGRRRRPDVRSEWLEECRSEVGAQGSAFWAKLDARGPVFCEDSALRVDAGSGHPNRLPRETWSRWHQCLPESEPGAPILVRGFNQTTLAPARPASGRTPHRRTVSGRPPNSLTTQHHQTGDRKNSRTSSAGLRTRVYPAPRCTLQLAA